MINILPDNFENLLIDHRKMWMEAQVCMDEITTKFEVTNTNKPSINGFYSIISKRNPWHFSAWKVNQDVRSFKLCLIKYESSYTSARFMGGSTNWDTNAYFFGHISLKKDFGKSLIRPETFHDKISELFVPIEVDFKEHPLFSFNYYVIAEDKEKLQNAFPYEFFKFMENIKGLQLEFLNHQCLFRLSKAINPKEGIQLCSIGITLDKLLNG